MSTRRRQPAPQPPIAKVEELSLALDLVRHAGPLESWQEEDEDGEVVVPCELTWSINVLQDAIQKRDVHLFTAALRFDIKRKAKAAMLRLVDHKKHESRKDDADDTIPGKADLLNEFKVKYPNYVAGLPKSPRSLATWWNELGLHDHRQGNSATLGDRFPGDPAEQRASCPPEQDVEAVRVVFPEREKRQNDHCRLGKPTSD